MKIFFVSPEIAPFAKTGGLAEVSYALPKALRDLGHDVRAVMPKYDGVQDAGIPIAPLGRIAVQMPDGTQEARIGYAENSGVPTYFIENETYFHRDHYYGVGSSDYPDNLERFVFFCKAAIECLMFIGFSPEIIHCNDWQTAPLPAILKLTYAGYRQEPFFSPLPRRILSIHNLAYQGRFPESLWPVLSLPRRYYTYDFEFFGQINLMKGGIHFADLIHTVSPTYAWEIQHTEFGFGLQEVLRQKKDRIRGILNGVDTDSWNPERDPFTYGIHFSARDLSGKRLVKSALRSAFQLPDRDETPLLGLTSRFVAQKGLDLVMACAERILDELDTQLIVLGEGEHRYQDFFEWLHQTYPDRVRIYIGFDNGLAHRIMAGSDIFLMPSHFEPCGLSQIYSLRYGTLPVVRLTGGLADTIQEGENGFTFFDYTADAFFDAVKRAVERFRHQPENWRRMMTTAMNQDFSWKKRAEAYIDMYRGQ